MRIGLVIVTYQRFDRFKECFENVMKYKRDLDEIVIVEDGSKVDKEKYDNYFSQLLFNDVIVMRNKKNKGVAVTKNIGLKYFYDKGYDYIFTIEDDINILSADVFKKYIEVSEKTGYQYINFALHGPANINKGSKFHVAGIDVMIYPHIVGAFSLHTKKLIDELGFYDEKFYNAWEHVDYAYQAAEKDLTSPFWMFVDIMDADKYLAEQKFSIEDSSIRTRVDWAANVARGAQYFQDKNRVGINEIAKK